MHESENRNPSKNSPRSLETAKNPTEQEAFKAQMESLVEAISKVAKIMTHPALAKYTRSNGEENVFWDISLVDTGDGFECSTERFCEINQYHLMITNQDNKASIFLITDYSIEGSKFNDPVTNEAIMSMDFDFNTQASDIPWILQALLGMPKNNYEKISLDLKTRALDPSFKSVAPNIPPIIMRMYYFEIFTERGKKREITFNTKTYRLATMEPSPWLDQFGFPDHQSFPMNGQEALVRVNALIDFILPPLLKEIQNYGQAALPNPLSMTRRIG